jgi:uncharacterized protein YhbP (UPF0306 family)
MDTEQFIRDYLPEILHLSLGTSKANKPWVSEVHFAYDEDLNLYFRSLTSRRHSQEIAVNPSVSGSIVIPHGPTDAPLGVYFEGTARRLETDEERASVMKYFKRTGAKESAVEDAKDPERDQFYKITVSNWYVFDARHSRPSQKYHLAWPKP